MKKSLARTGPWLAVVLGLCLPRLVFGQSLLLTNGVQTYAALTSTVVTMSNTCELRVTNTAAPLTGCIINLNSPDAWLFLTAIKPSAVVAVYLGQVRVNGAAAVADGNVRVVQYGAGAVVIPQAPSFQPLQAFAGPHFTGPAASFSQYTYYTGSGLGALDQNISSFKLKRGYMAVLAENPNGSGFSQCYIAQDGDLNLGVLPASLADRVRFIYVTPWRWVTKKGIAGNIEGPLNVAWKYNWNLDQNSSRDLEYVAIRQTRWWPGLAQDWQSRGVNTVLGYNEPDSASQADIAVGDAIWSWPDLLATGLRVGSPAVTDGGRSSWLYPFMQQADAAGLRVDFVAVHYYWCYNPADPNGAATQMYNFLLDTYNHTHRPLWVTEWNNGANWTGCGDPTYAQQQAAVAAMINMLENAPFVERYAIYNWVEDVRRVEWDDGSLTAAGVTYRDQPSALSYRQALPDHGARSVAQFRFETNALDSSGYGNNALAVGAPAYTAGRSGQALVFDGTNNYVQLPPDLGRATNFSFAAWVNWDGGANWQRIFDLGNDTSQYLFLTPSSGSGTLRLAIKNGGGEQIVETAGLASNQWQHVCVTLAGNTARLYTNGVLAASAGGFTLTPASFAPKFNFLGRSQFSADPLLRGRLDEVQFADYAFTPAQVAALITNHAPQFATNLLTPGAATQDQPYASTIAGTATDADAGDLLTYSKVDGAAWLTVAANGALGGTPTFADEGTNYFTVRVTDAAGASAFAVVAIALPVVQGSGTWVTDADGNWSDAVKWSGNFPANGAGNTADFSTLNISANRTVTLDSSRSIGMLKFGDTGGAQAWMLVPTNDSVLTLDTGSATVPAIIVNQSIATNAVPLAGDNGFAKSGAGALVLQAANSVAGTAYLDSASTSANDGLVRIAHPNALADLTSIQLRNNNSGRSALQLDGAKGGITTPASVALSGRTTASVAVENVAGTNTVSGGLSVNAGGNYFLIQSDSGLLSLDGTVTSTTSGARTLTFQGAGDFNLLGTVADGSGVINLTKVGPGTLTLSGANTHTGTNRIGSGTLRLANPAALQGGVLDLNAADAGTLSFGGLTDATFGGLTGSRGFALVNGFGAPVRLSVGANNLNQTYTGSLSGAGGLMKVGTGTFTLGGVTTFTGSTRIGSGSLILGHSLALLSSTVDLAAGDTGTLSFGTLSAATLGGLSGSRNLGLTNNAGAPVTLTLGNNGQNCGFAGVLSGPGSLIKSGAGVLTLSAANLYAGNTTVNGGVLKLSRDPLVKFSFDDTTSTTNGSIVANLGTGGSRLSGVVVNGASGISLAPRASGNALNLSGDGSYVSIADRVTSLDASTPGTDWTLALWIKTSQAGAGYAYQGDGGWASGNTAFYLNQGNTSAGTRVGAVRWAGGWLTGNASVNDGNWHFIAIAGANGTKNIYVDGHLDATTTSWTHVSTGNLFWIGGTGDAGDGVAKMNGQLDEVAIYNRALSLAEVCSLTNGAAPLLGTFGGQLPAGTTLAVSTGAAFDLGGNAQTLAALADGSGGGLITNSTAIPAQLTLNVGAGTATFSGGLADDATLGALSVIKNGAGTQIFSGASSYRGTTTVNGGALLVNGSLAASAVSVVGGTLGGKGTLSGLVNLGAGAQLSPGASLGTLTVSNAVNLGAGSVTLMEISAAPFTNDQLRVTGTLKLGGTLTVTNLGGTLTAGEVFPLFSAGAVSGAFDATNLPPLADGLAWRWDAGSGTLAVESAVATNPTNLTAALAGSALTLSWPADHTGWQLQVQTNPLAAGLGTNWFSVANSAATNVMEFPVSPADGSVFYRLIWTNAP
ncbi:MAG TPA: LamG-like jellyroll fold domain-containing protein [Verrucomicrobiae bacterium]|nr:LamG-like jellyroll fold domain-containing protein [Verrucomicrobiae bacterium]